MIFEIFNQKKKINLLPENQKPPRQLFLFLKLSSTDLVIGLNKYNKIKRKMIKTRHTSMVKLMFY